MEKKFALLIDADNVSAKYIKPILNELSRYGNITYKRIYGDWTSNQHSSWKEVLLQNSISPIQQFSYTQGKNATDSAMIIDAMDILYTGTVDGFCIVSSDSDFTRLASRMRETGLTVIGMGEDKTPQPFRKACDIFTCLELLLEENEDEEEHKKHRPIEIQEVMEEDEEDGHDTAGKESIEEAIIKIITENQNTDKETGLAEVGNRLVKIYPDFDVRSYGYSLLSKFLEEFPRIHMTKKGNMVTVSLNEDISKKEQLERYIVDVVRSSGQEGTDLAALGKKVREQYHDFKTRDYGYSQFHQFVRSISNIEIKEKDKALKAFYY